jgi:hypothetical protein
MLTIYPQETRCFLEEMPKETMMTANYHAMMLSNFKGMDTDILQDTTAGLGVQIKITDPDNKIILERTYGSRGKFAFTTHKPGNHKMCLRTVIYQFTYYLLCQS